MWLSMTGCVFSLCPESRVSISGTVIPYKWLSEGKPLQWFSYLHDGFFIREKMAEQRHVCLAESSLVGDGAALSAGFSQDHSFGNFTHFFQMFYPHLHKTLTLQADVFINWDKVNVLISSWQMEGQEEKSRRSIFKLQSTTQISYYDYQPSSVSVGCPVRREEMTGLLHAPPSPVIWSNAWRSVLPYRDRELWAFYTSERESLGFCVIFFDEMKCSDLTLNIASQTSDFLM